MIKKSLKDCLEVAKKNNGTVSHSSVLYKFLWKCNKGHEWHCSLQSVELGAWCAECYFNDSNNLDPKKEYVKAPNKEFYYLYKITNLFNNKIYIGVHCTDNMNDNYMGSGKVLQKAIMKYGKDIFVKEYIEFFDDPKSAFSREKQIVTREFIKSNENYNTAEGGGGGFIPKTPEGLAKLRLHSLLHNKGKVSCIDQQGNWMKVTKEEFDSNPNLVGQTKGILIMRDKQGTICKVRKDDPRIASGELVGSTTGICVMKDKDGKIHKVFKNDPRIISGELVGVTKGSSQTAESNAKRSKTQTGVPMPQPYYKCDICKSSTSRINIMRWHNNKCKFKGLKNIANKVKKWNLLSKSQKRIKMAKFKKTGILDI